LQCKNKHVAAYERVVGTVYNLSKLDTNPHINNVVIRRKLMENYNPPKLSSVEDPILQTLRSENRLLWKVLPFLGATIWVHQKTMSPSAYRIDDTDILGSTSLHVEMAARLIFTPFASLSNLNMTTFGYLTKLNVEFIAGFAKELIIEKL